jgi:hypothetical protein
MRAKDADSEGESAALAASIVDYKFIH